MRYPSDFDCSAQYAAGLYRRQARREGRTLNEGEDVRHGTAVAREAAEAKTDLIAGDLFSRLPKNHPLCRRPEEPALSAAELGGIRDGLTETRDLVLSLFALLGSSRR